MNLFLKIFLWFLAASALMVGVVVFLNWTVSEPVVSRWQNSIRNQNNVYAATMEQIYRSQGEVGIREFLERVQNVETVTKVIIVRRDGQVWLTEAVDLAGYRSVIDASFATSAVELQLSAPDTALTSKTFKLNGDEYALVMRWDRLQPAPFFGESQLRYVRYGSLLLTSLLVCYALAAYLSSPIQKIRRATQRLAEGELSTRVGDKVGNRRDELAVLAKDFDVMAERIESLITSQQRLSRDVSHELRSPLARMNVALEIAKQKSNGASSPVLERIEAESNRLNEMISRLLTLSRLETGSQDFERAEIDLGSLVEQVVSDADFEANAVGKSVRIEQTTECQIIGSEELVGSAIENVLRNAVRYTHDGTTVGVSLTGRDGVATVSVRDHGGGVPEDELQKLFRPFYRVGEARDRNSGGTGLGLAIAEQAIKAHKGQIRARNEGDGLVVEIRFECK
ncbi:MAG TPA: ATP-binding protein [Pyrinomonadaceae bacterium]|nr:ATP-binding protein [Pyrinomonadaceae bacterium]